MKARRAGKLLLGGLCYAMGHFAYWRFVAFSRELRYILFKGGIVMDDVTRQALDNAAASSAIEGLPLSESGFKILEISWKEEQRFRTI